MGKDDQKEEREVLDSIFPDEITDIDESSFRISIALDITEDEDERPSLWLTVVYPEAYPDEGPRLDLSLPPNAPRIADLDLSSDKGPLLSGLDATIEESLGMAMVFTLVSTLKENVEAMIAERQQAVVREREQEAAAVEAKENEKFQGEPVTRESFLKWHAAFKAEQERVKRAREEKDAEDRKRKGGSSAATAAADGGSSGGGDNKLTGKQLWLKGMVGSAYEDEDEEAAGGVNADGANAAAKGIDKLTVKA